jgi:acetylornithine deacetylase/succinyl-diaminopimelate desuccinylase-like protein
MINDPISSLAEYIRFASVSTDPAYAEGMRGAREYAAGLLQKLGFVVETVQTPLHPILLAERIGDPAWPHIVLYGHYDVQPSDPDALWTTPAFEPTLREGRIFGRGAADNKGPTIVHMTALARVLQENPDLPLNLTYVIEGEEEMGSPSMAWFFQNYGERLARADCLLVSDTGSPGEDQIVVTTGLRGLVGLEMTVHGSRSDLHSGVHGGAVMNPIRALAELCASLHDRDGRVNVPGFYDGVGPIADWEREQLARYPTDEAGYREMLGVPELVSARGLTPLEGVRFGPTLEFNGIGGGYQGTGSKTVIPARAFTKITCRLVGQQDPQRILELLKTTLQERCPTGVRLEFLDGGLAHPYEVMPPHCAGLEDHSVLGRTFLAAHAAISECFGKAPLYLREGGSIPVIADFKKSSGLDSVMVGLFTPLDNLHAPDESFDLLWMDKAIETFTRVFKKIAGV